MSNPDTSHSDPEQPHQAEQPHPAEQPRQAEQVVREYAGTIWDQLTVFYGALTRAALFAETATDQQAELEANLARSNARMEIWANNSPQNFLAQHRLVSAEIAPISA